MAHCIYIADDSKTVRLAIHSALLSAGFSVLAFESGAQLLKALRAIVPDLVITDLYMNDADGFDVLTWVREHAPELPVIAISGAQDITGARFTSTMLQVAKLHGAAHVLGKTGDLSAQLVALVCELLRR